MFKSFVSIVLAMLFLFSCKTAPLQEKSDAEFALNAARRQQASVCSTKYFYLAEKTYERGASFFSRRDYTRAERAFKKARQYAEKAELECIVLKQKNQ